MNTNLLDEVVRQLEQRTGELRKLAEEVGISYDTILRIKNREGDPGYTKVQTLYLHLAKQAA